MASYGVDDPSDRPTRMANYGVDDPQPPEPESAPDPWYKNRLLLAVWATMVAILIVLIIYGLIQLSHGTGGGPSTTTPSTTPTRSSTPSPSRTTTPPSTTTPPPGEEQPPDDNGPPPANGPPPGQAPPPAEPPHHHHHLPHIPPTITLPHTVITLPPGF
jgi:hypothetical protein